MGLNFKIMRADYDSCGASWSYGGFADFRNRLCSSLGIYLEKMEGFGGVRIWDKYHCLPLYPLLNHSDCDGNLTYDQCQTIAPALRDVVKDWLDDDYDKINAIRLAEGMESVTEGDNLEFR